MNVNSVLRHLHAAMDRCVLATFAGACNFLLGGSREWRHISAVSFVHALEARGHLACGRSSLAGIRFCSGVNYSMCMRVVTYNVLSARGAYRLRNISNEIDAYIIGLTGTHGSLPTARGMAQRTDLPLPTMGDMSK